MSATLVGDTPRRVASPGRAANNIFWLLLERGGKAVGGVLIGVLIARHLGPEDYGRYGAAIGLATLAKEAVMLGLDRMIRRDLAAAPLRAGEIVGTSIALGLALAFAVALALTALAGRIVEDDVTRTLTMVVVWMALPQAFFACEVWFESAGMAKPLVWVRNIVWLLALGGRFALVFTQAGVLAFAVLALVEWVLTFAAVGWLLRRLHGRELVLSYSGRQLSAWLREGRPVIVMAVMNSAADRLMVLLTQNLATDDRQAGYLSAASRITDIWWSMASIVAAVFLPRLVGLKLSDPERCARATQTYANASLLLGLGAAVIVTLTAPWLMPLCFGAAYAPSAMVLSIVCWSGVAVFPVAARAQYLVSNGLLRLELPSVAAIASLQLGLAFVLIPRFGAIGAAVAITGGNIVGFYGAAGALPALRRASAPQFAAVGALFRPRETARAMMAFARTMVAKG